MVQAYASGSVPKEETRPQATGAVTLKQQDEEPEAQGGGVIPRTQVDNQFANPDDGTKNPVILEGFKNFAGQLDQLLPSAFVAPAQAQGANNHIELVLHPDPAQPTLMLHPDAGLLILKDVVSNQMQADQQNQNLQPLLKNISAQDRDLPVLPQGHVNANVPHGEICLDGSTDLVTQGLGRGEAPWGWVTVNPEASLKVAPDGEGIHAANVSVYGGKLVGVDDQDKDDRSYVTLSPTAPVYTDKDGNRVHYAAPDPAVPDADIKTFGLRRVEIEGDQAVWFRIPVYDPAQKDKHFDELLISGKNNRLDLRHDEQDASRDVKVPVVKVDGGLVVAVNDYGLEEFLEGRSEKVNDQVSNKLSVHAMELGGKAGGFAYAENPAQAAGANEQKNSWTFIPVELYGKDKDKEKGRLTIHKGYGAALFVTSQDVICVPAHQVSSRRDNDNVAVVFNQVDVYGSLYGFVGDHNKVVADGATIGGAIFTPATGVVHELNDTIVEDGSHFAGDFHFKGNVTLGARSTEPDDLLPIVGAVSANPYQMKLRYAQRQDGLARAEEAAAAALYDAAQQNVDMEHLWGAIQQAEQDVQSLQAALQVAEQEAGANIQAADTQLQHSNQALEASKQALHQGEQDVHTANANLAQGHAKLQVAQRALQNATDRLQDLQARHDQLAPGGLVQPDKQQQLHQLNQDIAAAKAAIAPGGQLQAAVANAQAAIAPANAGIQAGSLVQAVDQAQAAIAPAANGNQAGLLRQDYDAAQAQVTQHQQALENAKVAVPNARQALKDGENAVVQAKRVFAQAEADEQKVVRDLRLAQDRQQRAAVALQRAEQFVDLEQNFATDQQDDLGDRVITLSCGQHRVMADSTLEIAPEEGSYVVVDGRFDDRDDRDGVTTLTFEEGATLALTIPDANQAPLDLRNGAKLVLSDEKEGTALNVRNAGELLEAGSG